MLLLKRGLITYDEALRQSSNPDDFALRVKGIMSGGDTSWDHFEKGSEKTDSGGEADRLTAQNVEKY
jgi:twitching motility protein PilT